MSYLIASASVSRFTSTLAVNSGPSDGFMINNYVGRNNETGNANSTGTAQNLHLYISSWGSQNNIKCSIYDEDDSGNLLESVIVNSSVGTGQVSVALLGTTTITSGGRYRLGFYTEDGNDITLYSDTSGLTYRTEPSDGTYTSPADPSVLGSYRSFNEFYWAVDDVSSGGSIIPQIMHHRRQMQ